MEGQPLVIAFNYPISITQLSMLWYARREAIDDMHRILSSAVLAVIMFGSASTAEAQAPTPPERRWSVEFGIGWDKGVSGNINSGAIGTLNGPTVVILKNKYEDVYGTGLNLRFGGGYLLKEDSEVRVTFTLQSLDADLTRMGDYGASNLVRPVPMTTRASGWTRLPSVRDAQALDPRVRRGHDRAGLHRRDGRPALGASGELHGGCLRFLRPHGGVHLRRERRCALRFP